MRVICVACMQVYTGVSIFAFMEAGGRGQVLSCSIFIHSRQDLSLNLEFDWQSASPSDSAVSIAHGTWVIRAGVSIPGFKWVLGSELRSSRS